MIIMTVGAFILTKKKGSQEFEDKIYDKPMKNEIKLEVVN